MPPSNSPSRLRAWLELCRISNLPTVWTNVLTGCAIAAGYGWGADYPDGSAFVPEIDWLRIGVIGLAMSLFYVAGMALNDLADVQIDQLERPHRPIPSGRVSKGAALNFIMFCFVAGLVLMAWFCFTTKRLRPESLILSVVLIATIMAYDFTHKRFVASVVLMGLCRSLVVLIAAVGASDLYFARIALPLAGMLGFYVVMITVIARGEMESNIGPRKWLAVLMPVMVLGMLAVVWPGQIIGPAIAGLIIAMWMTPPIGHVTAKPPQTIKAVLAWLSGICLVDAYFLTLLNALPLALIACGCFVLTAWGHRKILGT